MKSTIFILFIFTHFLGNAQFNYFHNNTFYDFTLASSGKQSAATLSWSHLHGLGKNKKFRIGYGLRITSSFGGKVQFITAPAKLTSGTTGPGVIFAENIPTNFDTLNFSSYQINMVNAAIYLNYSFSPKLEIEFNIDAIGFSFGKGQTGEYKSSKRLLSPNTNLKQQSDPTSLNALLVSDNDIGSLNSEILFKYWFKPNWALKAGGSFIFSEYTTANKLYLNNDRFRNKAFLPMLGLVYTLNRL
jgi:hypothetical protein